MGSQIFLSVAPSGGNVVVTTASLPTGTVGSAYAVQMQASGGTAPYHWSATGLPPGLSLSSSGLLSGTPTSAGAFNPAFTAFDTFNFSSSPPTVLSVTMTGSGSSLSNGQAFSVTVPALVTKSRGIAPLIWDQQTNGIGTVDPQWLAARPALTGELAAPKSNCMQIQPTTYNPQGSNVGPPHPYVGGIYAGTAYDSTNPSGTPNWTYERFLRWGLTLPSTIQSGDTCCVYASWYERNDPLWTLSPTTGNNKHGGYGPYGYADTGPGESSAQSWIWNINNTQPNNNTNVGWLMLLADNSSPTFNTLESAPGGLTDRNGHTGYFWGHKLNPFNPANGWLHCEMEMGINIVTGPSGTGYLNLLVNGQRSGNNSNSQGPFVTYAGRTDNFMSISPTARSINFGCGMYEEHINDPSTTNYLAGFYCDMSAGGVTGQCARLVACDSSVYANAVRVIPQKMATMTQVAGQTVITGNFSKADLQTASTAYWFYVHESGTVYSCGSVTVN